MMAQTDLGARQRNEDLVRRYVKLHNRGADAVLAADDELLHPDCELIPAVVGGIESRSYRGKDGLRLWYAERDEAFEGASLEIVSCTSVADDVVLVLARSIGRGRGSGAEVNEPVGVIDEFRDGLITCIQAYTSHREAEEASRARA